ncbi:MAG: hypothetical protein ACK515_19980 [bacterium]|jgi:hypothetical protein|nr:hypothetical protein [Betaproteobacteria bacterium]
MKIPNGNAGSLPQVRHDRACRFDLRQLKRLAKENNGEFVCATGFGSTASADAIACRIRAQQRERLFHQRPVGLAGRDG